MPVKHYENKVINGRKMTVVRHMKGGSILDMFDLGLGLPKFTTMPYKPKLFEGEGKRKVNVSKKLRKLL